MLSIFNSPEGLGDVTQCLSSIQFDGGLSCAKFVPDCPDKVNFLIQMVYYYYYYFRFQICIEFIHSVI